MKSFDELYRNYYNDVFLFLYKLGYYHRGIAEELTQETFYHAYLGITKFRGDCSVKSWLLQIAKNRYLMFLRKDKKELSFDELLTDIVDRSFIEPLDKLYEMQLIADSLNIVFSFPETMMTVFINRIYLDMPYIKIAQQLHISESSAKVLFYRSKLLLRKKLKEEYRYEI